MVEFEKELSRILASIASMQDEDTPGINTTDEHRDALIRLRKYLETARPMKCNELMDHISSMSWPESLKPAIESLRSDITSYRYENAISRSGELLEKLGKR